MGTNCTPLTADLFFFIYFAIKATSWLLLLMINKLEFKHLNSASRYLDDLLYMDNPYFEGIVNRLYPAELQLNTANVSDIDVPF